MENTNKEIKTIRVAKDIKQTKDGKNSFPVFKMDYKGKAVDLSFRDKDNHPVTNIPVGISKIKVEDLQPAKNSFYPKYWATYVENAQPDDKLSELK